MIKQLYKAYCSAVLKLIRRADPWKPIHTCPLDYTVMLTSGALPFDVPGVRTYQGPKGATPGWFVYEIEVGGKRHCHPLFDGHDMPDDLRWRHL